MNILLSHVKRFLWTAWMSGEGGQVLKKQLLWLTSPKSVPCNPCWLSWPRTHLRSFREISCVYAELSLCSPHITACQNRLGSSVLNTHIVDKITEAGRSVFPRSHSWSEAGTAPGSCCPGCWLLFTQSRVGEEQSCGSVGVRFWCLESKTKNWQMLQYVRKIVSCWGKLSCQPLWSSHLMYIEKLYTCH